MNARIPDATKGLSQVTRDHTPEVVSRRRRARLDAERDEETAKHLRNAIAEIRGTKTSIAKARHVLPRCDADIELQLEIRKLYLVETALIAIARRFESSAYAHQQAARGGGEVADSPAPRHPAATAQPEEPK